MKAAKVRDENPIPIAVEVGKLSKAIPEGDQIDCKGQACHQMPPSKAHIE